MKLATIAILLFATTLSHAQVFIPLTVYKPIYLCFQKIVPWSFRTTVWTSPFAQAQDAILVFDELDENQLKLHWFDDQGYRSYLFPGNEKSYVFETDHPEHELFFQNFALRVGHAFSQTLEDELVSKGVIRKTELNNVLHLQGQVLQDPKKLLLDLLLTKHIPRIQQTYEQKMNWDKNRDLDLQDDPYYNPQDSIVPPMTYYPYLPKYNPPSIDDLFAALNDTCGQISDLEAKKLILDALTKVHQQMN